MSPVSFDNYMRSGDVGTIAICVVIIILLMTSYVSRTHSLRIFMNIIVSIVLAALVNMVYHGLLARQEPGLYNLVYTLRVLYHALLFDVFFLFSLYTTVVSGMEHRKARIVAILSTVLFVGIVVADILFTANGHGFHIDENGVIHHRTNLFMIGYVLYIILLTVLLKQVHKLLYKRVMYGVYGIMAVSVLVWAGEHVINESSLATMTFVFPAIAMLYIFHCNPYNVALGAVDVRAMEEMVRNMYERKEPFIFLSVMLPDFDEEGKELPREIQAVIRRLSGDYFRGAVLFQTGNGHMTLIVPVRRNPDYEQCKQRIIAAFERHYRSFRYPYKVVMGESVEEISRKNEYVSLIRDVQRYLPDNTVYWVKPEDIERFNRNEYILHELADIYSKRDVNDPRVLAFCQPVFNLRTGRCDTAEALMRLNLPEAGLVFPDQFIPLAESHGYIHVLTQIILNKTCREIRRMTEEGFHISRISVNVSVLELKDETFCGDIIHIIDESGISSEKIAIELTESRNEADFILMKRKIEELRAQGIQFYLDDFGTGYSNMERIMELPFDIIKFDRSLVIASGTGERSERIVENLAHMFRDMEYAVLYEGVEDETDEERCREMSASYLQGYKYSRPVPIERLRDFLPRAA